jgi:hypothetical protein
MNDINSNPDGYSPHVIHAVKIGFLVVNGPVLGIFLVAGLATLAIAPELLCCCLPGGFVIAWVWWSFSVPRWRRWAIRSGANPEQLQELGVKAYLVWPKGSIFEKTEFKVDD